MTETDDNLTEEAPGILSRWSRNKARNQLEQPEQPEQPERDQHKSTSETQTQAEPSVDADAESVTADAQVAEVAGDVDHASDEASEDELILTDEDMPAIDTLNADSDYSGFLNKGVSPELRQKALQHLFRLPKFNIRDGLNDYDEDYTYFEPLGDTVTSDMRWHAARKEREEREAREAEEALLAEQQKDQLEEDDVAENDEDPALADDKPEEVVAETDASQLPTQDDEPDSESKSELAAETAENSPPTQDISDATGNSMDGQVADQRKEIDDGSVI